MGATAAAGLPIYKRESLFYHVHAHLDVLVDGRSVPVPAGIGMSPKLLHRTVNGHVLVYSPSEPCSTPCISPLHTHDDTGVIHTESDRKRTNTPGALFTEWSVRLDTSCIGGYCRPATPWTIYLNGSAAPGDPSAVELDDHEEIAVVIGTPPAVIPSHFPTS